MMLPVEIDDVWAYDGVRYKVVGLPILRNDGWPDQPKWVPGVRYETIAPKDPKGEGDNQEFVRTRRNFQENFAKENIVKKAILSPLPEGACLECGGEGYIEVWNEVGKCSQCSGTGLSYGTGKS